MGCARAVCGAALAALTALSLLAPPALALSWQRSGGLPAGAGVDNTIAYVNRELFPAVSFAADGGVGLLTLQAPTRSQYRSIDGGRNWIKVSDNAFVAVYALSSTRFLAVGQLGQTYDAYAPNELFTGSGSTSVSWTKSFAAPEGGAAVNVKDVAVFPGGAFVLASVMWRSSVTTRLTNIGPDSQEVQGIWRYDAAANSWTQLFSNTFTTTRMQDSPRVIGIAATSPTAAWAVWRGMVRPPRVPGQPPAPPTEIADGRITFWDGSRWTAIRQGEPDFSMVQISMVGMGANQLWIVRRRQQLLHYNGAQWSQPFPAALDPTIAPNLVMASLGSGSILALRQGHEIVPNSTETKFPFANVFRFDGSIANGRIEQNLNPAFEGLFDFQSALHAASSQRAVLVYGRVSETPFGEPIHDFMGRVWANGVWTPIDTVKCSSQTKTAACSVANVVALPNGGAVLVTDDLTNRGFSSGVFYLA